MDTKKNGRYFYYVISVLFLLIGLSGINRLIIKADLPFSYSCQSGYIFSTEHFDEISPGDTILSLNGIKLRSLFQLETILDEGLIGQDTDLEIVSENNIKFTQQVHLARYYRSYDFIIVSLLVGLSFWVTSVFLISKKYGERSVTVLFWVLMLFSLTTMTSPGKYFPGSDWIAYLIRAFHVSSYFLGAVTFVHFTFIFPRIRIKSFNPFNKILYSVSFLFCAALIFVQIKSISNYASGWVFTMEKLWEITEIILLISMITGAVNLYLYYRKIIDRAERKKIEWIFWGIAAGACPFLLLWLLPRLLGFKEFIPEEFLLAFLVLVPAFFAMAVVRYHVFEIDVFVKKSILYSSLTFITIILYFGIVTVITFFANELMKEYGNLVSIFLILLIAVIFNPLQIRLRSFIDRIFYRENYDFEKTVSDFSAGIKNQNTITGLSKFVIAEIEKIIPVKKIALIAVTQPENRIRILSQNNFDDLPEFISAFRVRHLMTSDPAKIISLKEKVEPGIYEENIMTEVLKKWKINVVIPFVPEPKDTAGAVLLGDKLSEMRYSKQDIEIMNVLISNIALAFKKLQLQRKLVLEELEISRLEEINKLMTYYVSSVSHDLKTPLTSIKMFTEILKEQEHFNNGRAYEYLNIIEGESERLSRLINNVLNYTKIENGIKDYSFGKVNLTDCIEEVLKIMEYQFMMENFRIEKSPGLDIFIYADKDAVKEALINLLSNAIKYSPEKKIIRVSSMIENEYAIVKIEDEGIGISQEDIKNIFKPFVRMKNSKIKHTGGAGIGLSIVKNIMKVHKGKIQVESSPGKGSSFSLYFRLCKGDLLIG